MPAPDKYLGFLFPHPAERIVQRKLPVLIWALWNKDEAYGPTYSQKEKVASSNDGPKPLFSFGSEGDKEQVAPVDTGATQDGLPCKGSPETLFSQEQSQKNYIYLLAF